MMSSKERGTLVGAIFVFLCLIAGIFILFTVQDAKRVDKLEKATALLIATDNTQRMEVLNQESIFHHKRLQQLEQRPILTPAEVQAMIAQDTGDCKSGCISYSPTAFCLWSKDGEVTTLQCQDIE